MSLWNYELRLNLVCTENMDAGAERENGSAPDPPIREVGRSGIRSDM